MQSGVPFDEQIISHDGRNLDNPKASMKECGVGEDALLLLRRRVHVAGTDRFAFSVMSNMYTIVELRIIFV